MCNGKKILAIIPARGGSKGVKRKNIRLLAGKPLIAWTIEEAKKSAYIDRLIVSTEDGEIAEVSLQYGAEVPFLRPLELARDDTPGIEPVIHCIEWLKKEQGYSPDYVMLLQCTSPNRRVRHIDEAMGKMLANEGCADSVISVCRVEHPPFWMLTVNENGFMEDFIKHDRSKFARRQDIPEIYRLNGAIYVAKTDVLMQRQSFMTDKTLPYIMDEEASIDIDTELDFKIAELIVNEGGLE